MAFERKVVEAVQRGRNEAEVEAEFHRIEEELEERIAADMLETRRKLFDNLDRDVVARLRQRGDALRVTLDAFEQRLLTIARAELPGARFHEPTGPRFDYDGKTWTTEWPMADEEGWQFFRVAEDTLAAEVVSRARARQLPAVEMSFDYRAYVETGWPHLSKVRRLAGRSGWLSVTLLSVESPSAEIGRRDRLVVSGLVDGEADETPQSERSIDGATIDDLFLVPAASGPLRAALPLDRLSAREAQERQATLDEIERESQQWLDEETDKLDVYAEDLERAVDLRTKELDAEIKAAKKTLRANSSIALADKVKEQRRIKALEGEVDTLKMTAFQKRKEIRAEIDVRLDAIARALQATPTVTPILNIRWTVTK